MHMADALISPEVGGLFWVLSGTALARSCRATRRQHAQGVPLMGVLGAFVFAIQMINFSIPGTGSSGHLGGGLLLAILLGPQAAFLTIASVLVVQSLLFADGGLLALGCNLFNMGFLPVFVAYPFIYQPLISLWGDRPLRAASPHTPTPCPGGARPGSLIEINIRQTWRTVATILAAVAALLMGATAVALQTRMSGISALPLKTFLLALLPIHLVIGLAEGVATAGILRFFQRARPELVQGQAGGAPSWRAVTLVGGLAVVIGGCLSWGASRYPDGLEWAVAKVAGTGTLAPASPLHRRLDAAQRTTALLPDYGFPVTRREGQPAGEPRDGAPGRAGTTLSGLLGGTLTLLLVAGAALAIKYRRRTV